ncbi:MAG: transcription termination factor NusA [Patescibacteria group bacterium]
MDQQFNEEEFFAAIDMISEEKKLPREKVIETIEAALAVAYRKDYGRPQMEIKAKMGPGGLNDVSFFIVKEIIPDEEELKDELTQMHLSDARTIDPNLQLEENVIISAPAPENFGRIAAQTAKQVIIQRLREAERENIFNEFKNKEKAIISGAIQRIEGQNIFVDIGQAIGVILPSGRVPGEHYSIGQRHKFYLEKVENTPKGAQIVLSRTNPEFIGQLFTLEIPEIDLGSVAIQSIAREPGVRTKVSVCAKQEGVDPIGSCVGQKGTRVQAIINEVGNEKIDIVLWDENPVVYIKNALSPAKIAKVSLDQPRMTATIYVEADQQSLAIGRNGQNVKLASKLTGWKLDIVEASKEVLAKLQENSDTEKKDTIIETEKPEKQEEVVENISKPEQEDKISELKLTPKIQEKLENNGYNLVSQLVGKNEEELTEIPGIGQATAKKIIASLRKISK